MNILVCIPCLLTGGTEIQTLSLVKALRSAGHEVKVACYFEWNPEIVTRFEEEGATVYLMSPDGNRPHGLRKISSHLLRGFKKIIKETKPDVAHVQYMTPAALVIGILKLLGIRKIVATSHTDADIYSPNGLRIIRLLSRTCLSAFQCITLRAEESYFGNSRLFDGTLTPHFTIYNCLPEHIEVCRQPRAAITEGKTVTLGVVSRLERIKGMDLVIPAFAQVVATHPNVRLLVVGDGALKPFMERQAADFGLKDEIEFVGRQPQSELSACYDRIDVLLMPSRSEGFGLTALESMARGCVPVVANTGGLPEVVRDGIDGLLHITESITDLANKINTLINDPDFFFTLSSSAISKAKNFSFDTYQNRIKLLYNLLSKF